MDEKIVPNKEEEALIAALAAAEEDLINEMAVALAAIARQIQNNEKVEWQNNKKIKTVGAEVPKS